MKIKFGDIIVIFFVIILAVIIYLIINKDGNTVVIEANGEIIASFPLDDNREYVYQGEFKNVITIKNEKVYVSFSDCPDKVCVHSGKIDASNNIICCLPNRVVVRIANGKSRTDVMSG